MHQLIQTAKQVLQAREELPFSVYSSHQEQHLFNVPMIKPMLICVLDGCKKLGDENQVSCVAGDFIFLSNSPNVEMRNIPENSQYFALLVEFEYQDFQCFEAQQVKAETSFQGEVDSLLLHTLQQFVEWSAIAPVELWPSRRQELLMLLNHQGYEQVRGIVESPSLSHQLFNLISVDIAADLGAEALSSQLAMSESTLRRKLSAEGTNLQAIKDKARLGHGLHMVQTTANPIGLIAEQCGYQSQSRFTDKFKQQFGITPSDLRKTRMRDLSE